MRGAAHLNSSRLTSLRSRVLSDQTRLIPPLTFTAFPFLQALLPQSFPPRRSNPPHLQLAPGDPNTMTHAR